MCIFYLSQLPQLLVPLSGLNLVRGEMHVTCGLEQADELDEVRAALAAAGLGIVTVNASESAGYVLHRLAADLHIVQD